MYKFAFMKKTRRKHAPEFKAKVAIEALKGQETLSSLSEKFGISAEMICRWKSELLANASLAFDPSKASAKADTKESQLYEKIGRLEMKLDFAKRVSEKLGIQIPADD